VQTLLFSNLFLLFAVTMAIVNFCGQKFRTVDVIGDGNCMFSALAHSIFSDQNLGLTIRREVVPVVINQWDELGGLTSDRHGNPFPNPEMYRKCLLTQTRNRFFNHFVLSFYVRIEVYSLITGDAMMRPGTYGASELFAASAIFSTTVQVLVLSAMQHCTKLLTLALQKLYLAFNVHLKHFSALDPIGEDMILFPI